MPQEDNMYATKMWCQHNCKVYKVIHLSIHYIKIEEQMKKESKEIMFLKFAELCTLPSLKYTWQWKNNVGIWVNGNKEIELIKVDVSCLHVPLVQCLSFSNTIPYLLTWPIYHPLVICLELLSFTVLIDCIFYKWYLRGIWLNFRVLDGGENMK